MRPKSLDDYQILMDRVLDPEDTYSYEDFRIDSNDKFRANLGHDVPKIDIDFVNESDNDDPDWKTSGSAGFDLRASENDSIKSHEFKVISTGLFFDLPDNFEMQIRPRSGLAAKHGITVLNSPGTIDSDYTGEIKVILINHSDEGFVILKGDRIAQAVISTVMAKNIIKLNKVSDITKDTERGAGGFGSTGMK